MCPGGNRSALLILIGDFPAQLFRADLFRRDGFVVWDSQWFGGHPTLPYSLIAPAVSALLTIRLAVINSTGGTEPSDFASHSWNVLSPWPPLPRA